MALRKTRLAAARRHGQRAVTELRHLSADAALYWVLSHRARVAQFRRAVKGTAAAPAVDRLLAVIRDEATRLQPPRSQTPPRRSRRARRHVRAARAPQWLRALASVPLAI